MDAILPPSVEQLVAAYLELADAEAPGLIEGLYLVGSVALEEFRPGRSDVDFVAITPAPAELSTHSALYRLHDRLNARVPDPLFEGIYVRRDDLSRDPADVGPNPYVHERHFVEAGRFEVNPVTWATLARHGVVVRGPPPSDLRIRDDPASLERWTRQNLRAYWRPWRAQAGRLLSRPGLAALDPWATEWGVLGVSRLHYTLATGRIASKYRAGLYALQRFPARWHRPIIEALRLRRGEPMDSVYRTPFSRRADLLRYVAMVIDDALSLPPRPR